MFYHFILTIHVMACLFMIIVILLQTGRGAGLSVFGGGGDSLVTTPTGSNVLKTMTQVLVGTFAFTSLFLTLLSNRTGMSSVTSRVQEPPPVSAPMAPAPAVPAASQQAPISPSPTASQPIQSGQ